MAIDMVGLVHARAEGPYSVYTLDPAPLHELARRLTGDAAYWRV